MPFPLTPAQWLPKPATSQFPEKGRSLRETWSPEEKVNLPPLWKGPGLRLQSLAVVSPWAVCDAPAQELPSIEHRCQPIFRQK